MKFGLLSVSLLCASSAFATPFGYGDLFLSTTNGVYRYSPTGTLLQVIGAGTNVFGLSFDRSGNLYTAGGTSVLKYDNSGNPLGTFTSGAPGIPGGAYDIDFDEFGNAYVVGVKDLNDDFVSKYTSSGTLLGTLLFLEGQENWVYTSYAGNNRLLVTPGTTVLVSAVNTNTLTLGTGFSNPGGGPNGDVKALPGGGFVVITGDPINQISNSNTLVMNYNTPMPTHGTWIGLDTLNATTFWGATDFGEVYEFTLGTHLPVTGFTAAGLPSTVHGLAVYTIPEPSSIALGTSGLCLLLAVRLRKRENG